MKSGIYRIINKVNGKCYIGSSTNIEDRLSCHTEETKRKISNKHKEYLLSLI